jgi:ubiquitin C-terminal hydrolase
MPQLSEPTRVLLASLDATHPTPLEEEHMIQGLPNVRGHSSFINAALQCLLVVPTFNAALATTMSFINARISPSHKSTVTDALQPQETLHWFVSKLSLSKRKNSAEERDVTTQLQELHRRILALESGEEDCCVYWEFVLSRVDSDVRQLLASTEGECFLETPLALPAQSSFGLVGDNIDSLHHYGLQVHLPIGARDEIQLDDAFQDWSSTLESFDVGSAAVFLIQRFSMLPNDSVMPDHRRVSFPLEVTMPHFKRRLRCVVAHRGTCHAGHHFALVRDPLDDARWIRCDDLSVQVVSAEVVLSEPCASVLVYGPEETTSSGD